MTQSRKKQGSKATDVTKLHSTPPRSPSVFRPNVHTHTYDYVRRAKSNISAEPELHVHQLLGLLRRRSLLILSIALFGALLAGAVVVLIPPKYTARAQIVVEPDRTVSTNATSPSPDAVSAVAIDTQMTMLVARGHLRAVLASLADDPAFSTSDVEPKQELETGAVKPADDGLISQLGEYGSQWIGWAGGLFAPNREPPSFDTFEKVLQIVQERRSRVVSVRYTSKHSDQSAAVVNKVVELYVANQTEALKGHAQSVLEKISTRIAELEREMATMEKTIRERLTSGVNDTAGQDVAEVPLRQLEREAAENAQLYISLLQRQKQLRAKFEAIRAPVRIVSLASPPEQPSSADPKLFILPAILLSLIGGGILAVILERFDRTLRSEHQVHAALGIPCVALVPKLGWFARKRACEYLLKRPFSPYAEAIRGVGAALQFSRPERPSHIMLVSSSVRGEGKTTLAASLATYATQLRRRVLLIDLDFRGSSMARTLGLKPERGVLDLIVSDKPVEDVVRRVPRLGLDVLLMPHSEVDPVVLFSNGELQTALQRLRGHYDYIVIDGPPLLGVTESSLFTSLVDTVVFAVKWGSTRRDVVQNALGELRNTGWSDQLLTERFRAVVTHVNLKRHARYRYGDSVELYVRGQNYYNPPQQVKSLAELDKLNESLATERNTHPVAAE